MGLLLLVSMIVVAALFAVSHLIVFLQAFRVRKLGVWRFLAIFQLPAPFIAWSGGARVWPALWFLLLATYLVLRAKG